MTPHQSRIICIRSLATTGSTSSGCHKVNGKQAPLFFAHKVPVKQPSDRGTFHSGNRVPLVGYIYQPDAFYTDESQSVFGNWTDWAIAALCVTVIVLEVAGVLA